MQFEATDRTGVLSGASRVLSSSNFVSVNEHGIQAVAHQVCSLLLDSPPSEGPSPLSPWSSHALHPPVPSLNAPQNDIDFVLNWIFTVSVLNFSFWSDKDEKERYAVSWRGRQWTGYWSLLAALHRALSVGIPITSPRYNAEITDENVARVFRSETTEPLPLLSERACVLREAGSVLVKEFEGNFRSMIEAARGSAVNLVLLVVEKLPAFKDEANYKGHKVFLYKRAQILVAETWAAFEGKGPGRFDDIEALTMFADYRVPQILHSLKMLTYSSALLRLLNDRTPLANGAEEEVEIRAASIVAVEQLRAKLQQALAGKRRTPVAVELDFWLWDLAKEEERKARERGETLVPHHRTRSVFY